VLDSVVQVPRGDMFLSLGVFGGRFSSVQMWNQQLTPDVIYGVYMMGPSQTQHNVITDVSKYLGVNATFTGSAPGQSSVVAADPFGAITAGLSDVATAACNPGAMMASIPGYNAMTQSMSA